MKIYEDGFKHQIEDVKLGHWFITNYNCDSNEYNIREKTEHGSVHICTVERLIGMDRETFERNVLLISKAPEMFELLNQEDRNKT